MKPKANDDEREWSRSRAARRAGDRCGSGPDRRDDRSLDRGQAYTLEGFVAAVVVLTALLFALQSVVITPTTGGAVDRSVQAQLQQEATDSLVVAENEGELSRMIRYWNPDNDSYYGSDLPSTQRGKYSFEQFRNESSFGALLEKRFKESGRSYNVELVYRTDGNTTGSHSLVYQGAPTSNAFAASHTVVLMDDHRLTAPGSEDWTVEYARDNDKYPIPDANPGGELFNVVEVRIVVW